MLQKAPFISFNSPSHFEPARAGLVDFLVEPRLKSARADLASSSAGVSCSEQTPLSRTRVKRRCPQQTISWSFPANHPRPFCNRRFQNPWLWQLSIIGDALGGNYPSRAGSREGIRAVGDPGDFQGIATPRFICHRRLQAGRRELFAFNINAILVLAGRQRGFGSHS